MSEVNITSRGTLNLKDQEETMKFVSELSKLLQVNRIVPHTIFKQYK